MQLKHIEMFSECRTIQGCGARAGTAHFGHRNILFGAGVGTGAVKNGERVPKGLKQMKLTDNQHILPNVVWAVVIKYENAFFQIQKR